MNTFKTQKICSFLFVFAMLFCIQSTLLAREITLQKNEIKKEIEYVKEIAILDSNIVPSGENVVESWNVSNSASGEIMAWLEENQSGEGFYKLCIGGSGEVKLPTNSSSLFAGFENCEKISGLGYLNTSDVTNVSKFFYNCKNLVSLDIENLDVSNVENMANMFASCSRLERINLNNFITSNVTDISSMFYNCERLKEIDISNFDTSKVTNTVSMFERL